MYILLIYINQTRDKIKSIIFFDKIKDIIEYTKGLIKYNDVNKNNRKYKTYKSFFQVLYVSNRDTGKYFT